MDLKMSNLQIQLLQSFIGQIAHLIVKSGCVDLDLKPLDLDLTIFERVGFRLDLNYVKTLDLDLNI